MKAETRRGSRDLRRAEASFDLDRALDWLDAAARKHVREVDEARRIVLKTQARLGFTRNQASPEYLAQLREQR